MHCGTAIWNEELNLLAWFLLSVIPIHTTDQERGEMDEGNRVDWRELCAAAATEPDSAKLADLVDQIIRALDERAEGLASPAQFGQP